MRGKGNDRTRTMVFILWAGLLSPLGAWSANAPPAAKSDSADQALDQLRMLQKRLGNNSEEKKNNVSFCPGERDTCFNEEYSCR